MHRPRLPLRSALIGAGLALSLSTAPAAGQGIPVTVGVGAIQSGAGAFDLPIVIDMSARTERLGSFVATLRWNPAVVRLDGGTDGDFGRITVNEDSVATGMIRMAGASPGGVSGLITLGVGRFTVLNNDTTTFRISVEELYAAGTFADLRADAVPLDRLFCGSLAGRWGDLTRDNAVNGADALVVLTESVGLDVSQYALGFGDVDSSGTRNPRDALIILSYAVGIPTPTFRVGQAAGGSICVPPGAQGYGLNPASAEALVGQDIAYFAFGLDLSGAALALRNVTWTSSNGGVATIDATGMATVLGTGTTTISALQNDTVIATGTLSVPTGRRTHWVDALAGGARNQLGSSALPFGGLAEAVGAAAGGDTIRVRTGRYAGTQIGKRLVVLGDTSAGGSRPVFGPASATGTTDTVMILSGAGRVELRDLRVDTAYVGVLATGTDTVVLRGVEVRGTAGGVAGVRVRGARLLHVVGSRIIGIPSSQYYYYYAADGIVADSVDRLVIDTTLVSDFTSDGVYALRADTIVVRGSTLRRNAGSGLAISTPDSASASRLVFSGNRVEQNQYGGVTGFYVADVQSDHNVFVGGGSSAEGVTLDGHRATTAAFLADSFDIREGGWLYFSSFDSLTIDSSVIRQTDYYGAQLYGGRVAVVRNSTFRDLWNTGLYFGGRGVDSSTILVRNVALEGRANAAYYYYSGYGIETRSAVLDVMDTRFRGLYYGAEVGYGAVRLRRVSYEDTGYGQYGYCLEGASTVDSVTARRVLYEPLYLYDCLSGGRATLVVDSLDVADGSQESSFQSMARVEVRRSRFLNVERGLYVGGDTVVVDAVDASVFNGWGIETYADSVGTITGSTASCAGGGAEGILVYGSGAWLVQGNAVTGACDIGVNLVNSRDLVARNNTVSGAGSYGVYNYQQTAGRHRLVGNVVSGPYRYGSIHAYLSATTQFRTAFVADSNTVSSATAGGIFVAYGDTVLVRDNLITGTQSAPCCLGYEGGIVATGYALQDGRIDVRRNRLTGNVRGLVLGRDTPDSLVQVTVDSNRIVGSDTTGIWITSASRVQARYNLIDSTRAVGVLVDRGVTPAGTDSLILVFTSNNITRNGRYGLYNQDGVGQPGLVQARGNWWGDGLGPSCAVGLGCDPGAAGDSVSAGVLWDPPLPSPITSLPAAPPAFGVAALTVPGTGGRVAARRPQSRTVSAPVVPEPPGRFTPRPRDSDDPWASALRGADQRRATQAATRLERLRERETARAAERDRRAAADAAREARRSREERP